MTDRAQLAFLGGDWPADLDPSLRCGTIGALVEQPALAVGDYLAPIGDDPTIPGRVGHCRGEGHGLYSIHWFDRYGDFTHSRSRSARSRVDTGASPAPDRWPHGRPTRSPRRSPAPATCGRR